MSQAQRADTLAREMNAMKQRLDTLARVISHGVEIVETLPINPVDGQEVYFQTSAMATKAIIWKLRYRAESTAARKWEFVGGAPLMEENNGDVALTLGSSGFVYQDLANSPNIILPMSGVYSVAFGCHTVIQTGAANSELDLQIFSSTNVAVTEFLRSFVGVVGTFEWPVMRESVVTVSALTELKMRVAGNSTVASGYRTNARFMRAIPLRLG